MNTKTNLKLAVIALMLAGSLTLYASHEVQFKDLPAAVQQTINRYKGDGELKRIERQIHNGATVYEIHIKRLGPNTELHLTESGQVLENDPNFAVNAPALQGKKLQPGDLPQVVQNAIRTQAGNLPIDDISETRHDNRTVYEIEFQRGGQNQELHVASDGTVFRNDGSAVGVIRSQPATAAVSGARKVTLNELPLAARRTVEREAGTAAIEDIDQMTKNGRTFYEVTFKRDGQNVNLNVAPDGSLTDQSGSPIISSAQPSARTPSAASQAIAGDRRVTFFELPTVVQNTIRTEVGSGRIESIDRKVRRGRTLFQVAYTKDGRPNELFVAENGSVILGGLDSGQFTLSNARKVTFAELPSIVQNTVRVHAGTTPIEDIDKGILNGRTAYQVAFKRDGRHTELTVAEDGTLISGQPVAAAPATTSPDVVAPLRDARKVTFNDLPSAVQNTVRAQAAGAAIEDIDKGILNGRTVYEAAYKQNGRHTELRVAEDGSIVGTVAAQGTPQP